MTSLQVFTQGFMLRPLYISIFETSSTGYLITLNLQLLTLNCTLCILICYIHIHQDGTGYLGTGSQGDSLQQVCLVKHVVKCK